MRQTSPKFAVRWIMGGCIALSAAGLPWLWAEHEGIRRLTGIWYAGEVETFVQSWRQIDRLMLTTSGTGNVALRFEGFSADNPAHVRIIQEAAGRGAYGIYPRRVLAAMEGTVGGVPEIIAARFEPTLEWLRANDVRTVLHFTPVGAEGFNIRPQAISPAGGR